MTPATLVLLPGLDGTGVLFRPLVEALPESIPSSVVAYPGDKTLGYSELIKLVERSLPADRPFYLLGESFAGPLALMIAERRPPNLRGVILCATFIRNPHPYFPAWTNRLVHPFFMRAFSPLSNLKARRGGYSSPEFLKEKQEALAAVRPEVLAHRIREVVKLDAAAALRNCPVPILYIRATRDMVVPYWNLKLIQKIRPDVAAAALAGPHMILQTRPDEASRVITPLLSR